MIHRRIEHLERLLIGHGERDCPSPCFTVIIDAGEEMPTDAALGPPCGETHVLEIVEEIIAATGQAVDQG